MLVLRNAQNLFWLAFLLALGPFAHLSPCLAATAEVDTVLSQEQYHAGGRYPLVIRVRVAQSWFLHGPGKSSDFLIPTVLEFQDSPGARIDRIQFPPPEMRKFEYADHPIEVYAGEVLIRAEMVLNKTAAEGMHEIKGKLTFQACSLKSCLPPEEIPLLISIQVASRDTKVTLLNQSMFSSSAPVVTQEPIAGFRVGTSFWLTLLAVFVGGLALNLTPCIYPLIPITVSYFGGQSGKIKGRAFIHGFSYISGLAMTNSLLGLSASLTGGMLGSALQNPIVLIVVAGIMVSLALSFFGLYELRIPLGLTRMVSKSYSGYYGTFFMGLTLGIVAAPCLGPFILGLLTYVGQKGDPFLGFIYFFVLSIGLGLPLTVLAIFSGTIEKLPMSGTWMVWVRKVLGWVLVAMAGYMLLPLIVNPEARTAMFVSILIMAGLHLGWLEKSQSASAAFSYTKKGFGIVMILASFVFLLNHVTSEERVGIAWAPYSDRALESAATEGRPVILDFYADWCGPCKALEKEVLHEPEIVSLSEKFIALRIDLTTKHPQQEELQKRYTIRGVPTIIFLNYQGIEERSLRVDSFVSKAEMLSRMKSVLK